MSWLRALSTTAQAGLKIERQRMEPLLAFRGTAGLALVVLLSLAIFGPGVAASSAFGAYQAGVATFERSWQARPLLALLSGATLAVSTFLGYLSGSHIGVFMALIALWTFVAGLAWAAGPTAGLIASSNVAMMLVTVTLPTSVLTAVGHAAMIAVGALVQAGLVVLFPVRRWGHQRDSLADALAAEADYARRLRQDPVAPFDPVPFMDARQAAAVTPREARRRPAALHGTRGLAERVRPVLASLADPAVGAAAEGAERDRALELLAAAASVLDTAARTIRHGEPVASPTQALAVLEAPGNAEVLTGPARRAAVRLSALLRDVTEAAQGEGSRPESEPLLRPALVRMVPSALEKMRKELRTHESAVLRHAIRTSVVAAGGYLIGIALPFGHGYWVPLAAVMVMRPDFSQTYGRAVARLCGTLLGVAFATAVVQLADPGPVVSGALAVLCAGLNFLLMRTGYAATSACIAAYVVFLLDMSGLELGQTIRDRVVLTLVGGLLAMVSYAVYPAWETPRLRNRLADWLIADGRYAAAVIAYYADPAGARQTAVREAVLAARAARIDWQEAVERAAHEPVRHRGISRAAASDAEDAMAQLSRAAMLMEAHLPGRTTAPVPAAQQVADALRRATERGARDIRARRVPHWDEVREALARWDGEGVPDQVVRSGADLLLDALDELTDALDDEGPRAKGDLAPRSGGA
ncbi:FUSC family protein [Streptomyces sp. NBC_01766]|uniref:FUSC family protein n=1 Tax=Streptomyces sp. NBC_01766 TaxID=2975936 RepID=UPI002DD89444|nr:FUSC family protein [Streptomyces sp. NBC_01766]WSC20748.1 FUSC family protein [Streptomyces sp. NBC_01766]